MKRERIRYYLEARRSHPELNVKVGLLTRLLEFPDTAFVRYVNSEKLDQKSPIAPKLGINPNTYKRWDTPAGICFYPIKYVIKLLKTGEEVPHGAEMQFIYVVALQTSKILDLQNYDAFDRDIKALKKFATGFKVRDIKSDLYYAEQSAGRFSNRKAATLYFAAQTVAQTISGKTGRDPAIILTLMLKAMGYEGVNDHGEGIIHRIEVAQLVVFNVKAVKALDLLQNKELQ